MAHMQHGRSYTYADLQRIPDDRNRYEIIDGELYVSPSPRLRHQWVSGQLHLLLTDWVRRGAGGKVFYAPLDVILADHTVVIPDLVWISPERLGCLSERGLEAIADLVIEIQSPSTARRDVTVKAQVYRRFGVREYWVVDPKAPRVTMLVPGADGLVTHATGAGGDRLVSSLSPDLVVVPEALVADDVP